MFCQDSIYLRSGLCKSACRGQTLYTLCAVGGALSSDDPFDLSCDVVVQCLCLLAFYADGGVVVRIRRVVGRNGIGISEIQGVGGFLVV